MLPIRQVLSFAGSFVLLIWFTGTTSAENRTANAFGDHDVNSQPGFDFGYTGQFRGMADVNGDGRADYCRFVDDAPNVRLSCGLSNGKTFGNKDVNSAGGYDAGYTDQFRGMADVNGDGRADYCRFVDDAPNVRLSCGLSNGKTFGNKDVNSAGGYDAGYTDRFRGMADVNGDGRADYCRFVDPAPDVRLSCGLSNGKTFGNKDVNSAGGYDAGYTDQFRGMADVNGDGRADYCRFVGDAPSIYFSCGLSNGKAFGNKDFNSIPGIDGGYPGTQMLGDVNGDGRADFCRLVGDSLAKAYISCALAGLTGFGEQKAFDSFPGYPFGDSNNPHQLADVNADGKADFCRFRPTTPGPGFSLSAGLSTRGGVVNMIPASLSAETNQDSEPFLSVHPGDWKRMAASAFTPNPAGPGSTAAPLFVTVDGGTTWTLNPILPSQSLTGDITHAFDPSGALFAGILRLPTDDVEGREVTVLDELMARDFTRPVTMTLQGSRREPDQPFVQTQRYGGMITAIGNNDGAARPATATVDVTSDGGTKYESVRIESRATCGQDGPSVRPAISGNRVYAAFYGWRACRKLDDYTWDMTSDVVMVRDDKGGTSRFQSLTGTDGKAGVRIVTGIPIRWSNAPTLGQERIGSTLSVAAHPGDEEIVYVAWADGGADASHPYTLHVRRSTDGGKTWPEDLRTIPNATNAALAVNAKGTLAFLYQQFVEKTVTPDEWTTRLEQISSTGTLMTTTVLAQTLAHVPEVKNLPYLGDYTYVMAVGNEFRGAFSASNYPEAGAFPSGVTFQRAVDFNAMKLFDRSGTEVKVSIDPFYFQVADAGGLTP